MLNQTKRCVETQTGETEEDDDLEGDDEEDDEEEENTQLKEVYDEDADPDASNETLSNLVWPYSVLVLTLDLQL